MNESVVPEKTGLDVSAGFETARSVVFVIFHVSLVAISVFLGDDGIGAIAVLEGALETIPVGIVNATFAVFFAVFDLTFVITAVEVLDFLSSCAHINLSISIYPTHQKNRSIL